MSPSRKWKAMGYYRTFNPEGLVSGTIPNALTGRYAWLEHEEGIWHLLTNLFADPVESTRRWSSRQLAFNELMREGWVIVGAYPENPAMPRPVGGGSRGYGLMQVGRWKCESDPAAG